MSIVYIEPFARGLSLGLFVTGLSYVMDVTVSKKSFENMKMEEVQLYHLGWIANITNLCVLSPVLYSILMVHLIQDPSLSLYSIYPSHVLYVVFIHNIFYYLTHKAFHIYPSLLRIHYFHHKFDRLMLPSVGNAVSKREFILAYVTPFFIGAAVVPCSESSMICSVGIISLLNLFIHCKELENIWWVPFLVSPKKHITHHIERTKHYSAPFFDFDEFIEQETSK